jgi:hypothetical protein
MKEAFKTFLRAFIASFLPALAVMFLAMSDNNFVIQALYSALFSSLSSAILALDRYLFKKNEEEGLTLGLLPTFKDW